MLSLGITGCATRQEVPVAFECVKPPLRGETWADVAILSVEQSSAIDVCNIRNGVDSFQAPAKAVVSTNVPLPTAQECIWLGVDVVIGQEPTGIIVEATEVEINKAPLYCPKSTIGTVVGCTTKVGNHKYTVLYEQEIWIRNHEACHAYYEAPNHTMDYLTSSR